MELAALKKLASGFYFGRTGRTLIFLNQSLTPLSHKFEFFI
jgi:hypothetical protein